MTGESLGARIGPYLELGTNYWRSYHVKAHSTFYREFFLLGIKTTPDPVSTPLGPGAIGTLRARPSDPFFLRDSRLPDHGLERLQWVARTSKIHLHELVRLTFLSGFDPSFVRAFQGLKESEPVLFEKCCALSIHPVVQSSCHAPYGKCAQL